MKVSVNWREHIRKRRLDLGLLQYEVATAIGVTESTVWNWKHGTEPEQSGVGEEVELEVQDNQILFRPASYPRQEWEEAFRSMAEQGDDLLLDKEIAVHTRWDIDEW